MDSSSLYYITNLIMNMENLNKWSPNAFKENKITHHWFWPKTQNCEFSPTVKGEHAILTLCGLPVELQRGRRPISIKNHDMAQETPRFSEEGPWTREQFARQGTLISFFPRLWNQVSRFHMILYYLSYKCL